MEARNITPKSPIAGGPLGRKGPREQGKYCKGNKGTLPAVIWLSPVGFLEKYGERGNCGSILRQNPLCRVDEAPWAKPLVQDFAHP